MKAAFLSDSDMEMTKSQQSKPSLRSGHMHSDPSVPSASSMSMTRSSGLSTRQSQSTTEASDWCERFDCNQRCMNYIRKAVADCLRGLVNFSPTGNVSWKIPERRKDGGEEGRS